MSVKSLTSKSPIQIIFLTLTGLLLLWLPACDLLAPSDQDNLETVTPPPTIQQTALARVTLTPTFASTVTNTPSPAPSAIPSSTVTPVATSPIPTATALTTATTPPTSTATPAAPTETPTVILPPSPTPTTISTPMPLWSVTYFNNLDLSGDAVLTSESDSVGHYWGLFRPDGVDDAFSVRWQRRLELDAETYRIFVWSRDGIRIRINDVVVLEEWTSGPLRQNEVVVGVVDGTFDLDVEHFSTGGLDDIFVWWVPTDSEGWLGSYWPNPALEGSPELVQEDEAVSFDWGISSPIPGYTNGPFSARWSQTLPLDEGLYRFSVNFDDGARVYLDGNLIIDDWQQGFRRDAVGELWVSEGMHEVVVEYFERQGDASIELNWEKLPDFTGGWLAEIYPNPWLSGNPIHQSLGNILDFQWESGSPLPQIPHDQFSVRWVRQFFFEPGLYQIKVMSDDGVRLFINDELILDEWHNSNFSELHELVVSLEATQLIEIHYYEDSGSAVFRMSIERLGPLVE